MSLILDTGEYLTMGLFMSGSIVSVIIINKPLNLVLFHKYSLFLIILKFSIKGPFII